MKYIYNGYPCLNWADVHFPRIYGRRHELDLLTWEAQELERSLAEIRDPGFNWSSSS